MITIAIAHTGNEHNRDTYSATELTVHDNGEFEFTDNRGVNHSGKYIFVNYKIDLVLIFVPRP